MARTTAIYTIPSRRAAEVHGVAEVMPLKSEVFKRELRALGVFRGGVELLGF